MISDIYMIQLFYAEGKTSFANANVAMITMNWFFQLVLVWLQTGRNILGSAFLKEAFITTLGLKPGLDAWRACNGKEKQPGQIFDAITEVRYMRLRGKIYTLRYKRTSPLTNPHHPKLQMAYSKVTEMFAEAIPAGVLQIYAFFLSQNRTAAAFASILISSMTTGFGSALISYGELRRTLLFLTFNIFSPPFQRH